jgi:macrolide transport system ATP-binding/permease protein
MRSVAQRLRRQYPDTNRYFGSANLVVLRDFIVGDVRPILLVLLSGAGVLLLIASVNVTTLLLARSDKRRREIALGGAIGASSSRLFHQFATEGFVLAFAGCILGLAFAGWSIRLLTSLIPAEKIESMPYLRDASLNAPTVVFACSIAFLAGLLFSVIPIARGSLSDMMDGLKEGTRGSAGTSWRRFGSSLVVVEVALTMVLMVSAGLLAKSLYQLLHLDLGFNPDHLVYVQTSWAPGKYETDQQLAALDQQMTDAARRAGTKLARTADAVSTTAAAISICASPDRTPNSIERNIMAAASEPSSPKKRPVAVKRPASLRMSRYTVSGRAPSAVRTRISRVLWPTK